MPIKLYITTLYLLIGLTLRPAEIAALTVLDVQAQRASASLHENQRPSEWIQRMWGSTDAAGEPIPYLVPYQIEIADALGEQRRAVVASSNATGKTHLAAHLALEFLDRYKPSIVLTTAASERQVEILWAELKQAFRTANYPLPGRLLEMSLRISEKHYAKGFTAPPRSGAKASGFHESHVLVIVDEASEVTDDIFDSLKGVMAGGRAYHMVIGNPDNPEGRFFDLFSKPNKYFKKGISAFETPNLYRRGITLDDIRSGAWEAKYDPDNDIPGLVDAEWVFDVWSEYGEAHPFFISRVLGRFPMEIEHGLIPLADINACQKLAWANVETAGDVVLGVDVARSERGDDSAVFWRKGNWIESYWVGKTPDTMKILVPVVVECIGFVKEKFASEGVDIRVNVDSIGVGGPIADRVDQIVDSKGWSNVTVASVNVGTPSEKEPDKFENLRSDLFFHLAQKARQRIIRLPECPNLRAQLYGMKWMPPTSRGRTRLEPKDETKKRIKRSPDEADAAMLTEYCKPEKKLLMEWI